MKFKIIISILTILVVLSIIIYALLCAFRYYGYGGQPFLKVVTQTEGTLIFPGNKVYYDVYASGYAKSVENFDFNVSDVEAYRIDENANTDDSVLIENTTGKYVGEGVATDYAHRILALVDIEKRFQSGRVYKIYILENRIFFDVFVGEKGTDTLFEYLPNEDKIRKIVEFKRKNIEHIELYK